MVEACWKPVKMITRCKSNFDPPPAHTFPARFANVWNWGGGTVFFNFEDPLQVVFNVFCCCFSQARESSRIQLGKVWDQGGPQGGAQCIHIFLRYAHQGVPCVPLLPQMYTNEEGQWGACGSNSWADWSVLNKAFSVKHYYLLPVVLGSCSYALFIKQMYGDGRGLPEQDCILP